MKLTTKILVSISSIGLMGVGTFTALNSATNFATEEYRHIKSRIRSHFAVEVPRYVDKVVYEEPETEQIIKDASERYGLPEILLQAVIDVESGGRNASRFEPRKYETDNKAQSEFERLMRNTSHGRMQVMGFNASTCGLTWQDLYQPSKGIDCGAKILRNCYQRSTGKTEAQKLTQALGCYNGDPVRYPEKVKAALIDRLVTDRKVQFAMNLNN